MGNDDLTEPLKKRVGGSLSRLPPLQRLEMLRRNALMLRGGKWSPPQDEGTFVRKVVGAERALHSPCVKAVVDRLEVGVCAGERSTGRDGAASTSGGREGL